MPHPLAVHSKESRGSSHSSSDGAPSLEGLRGKMAPRGVVPVVAGPAPSPLQVPPPLPLALDMGDAAFLGPRKQCHQTQPPLRVILRAAWVPPPPFWSSLPADILTRLQLSL